MEGYGTDAYIHLNKLSSSREYGAREGEIRILTRSLPCVCDRQANRFNDLVVHDNCSRPNRNREMTRHDGVF